MSTIELDIDGHAFVTEVLSPSGPGPWPAVILCFDAGGQRAAMTAIGQRIANNGYLVAIPDFYYRAGPVELLMPEGDRAGFSIFAVLKDPALRAKWQSSHYAAAVSYENLEKDVGALLDVLSARSDIRGGVALTGYCMGGNIAFRIATLFGERISAVAAFHPGSLVTSAPDSPHLRAATIDARVFVAGASEDATFSDDAKKALIAALEAAQITHTVETYPAKHGFAVSDNPSFDSAAAERHYSALDALLSLTFAH